MNNPCCGYIGGPNACWGLCGLKSGVVCIGFYKALLSGVMISIAGQWAGIKDDFFYEYAFVAALYCAHLASTMPLILASLMGDMAGMCRYLRLALFLMVVDLIMILVLIVRKIDNIVFILMHITIMVLNLYFLLVIYNYFKLLECPSCFRECRKIRFRKGS